MVRKDCDKAWPTRWYRGVVWAAVLAGMPAAHVEAGTIVLWNRAVASAASVRLGDVARLEGFTAEETQQYANVVMTPAPPPGGSTILSLAQVREALRAGGVNLAQVVLKGAAHCDVTCPRGSTPVREIEPPPVPAVVGGRNLRQAVAQFLEGEIHWAGARLQIQYGRVADTVLDLSEPQFQFEIKRQSGDGPGLIGLEVLVTAEGRTVQQLPLLVNVTLVRPVVVAAGTINLGANIEPDQVRVEERSFTRIEAGLLSDTGAVVGQRARRFFAAGESIAARDLEAVPLVKRGQVVEVLSRAGGVVIRSAAKAVGQGTYGDLIELQTGERGRQRLLGRIVGSGRVEISAGGEGLAAAAPGGGR